MSAQHYRLPPKVSQELSTRQQAVPKEHRQRLKGMS